MAPIGRMKCPMSVECFSPPHLPRNSTALGGRAVSKSMIVAAFGEPMPKLIIVRPSEFVAACIGRSAPNTWQPNFSANRLMYVRKFVSRTYWPNRSSGMPV